MAYRSVYDEQEGDLGIGGQEYLVGTDGVVNNMYAKGDYQTGQYGSTPQADRSQSLTDEQQTLNMPAEKGVKGGKGASGIIGSIIGAAGGVASAGDAAYQKNYASRGLTAAAEGKGIYGSINKVKESGALGNIAGTIAQNTAVDYQAVDRSFRSGKYGRALGQIAMHGLTGAGTFGGTSLISGGEQREYAEQQALLNPNVAQVRGVAVGGYAMGGSQDEDQNIEMKKIKGRKGLDNVPIDGDFNNANDSGRTIKGFGQAEETIAKIEGRDYAFGVNTGFTKEADTIARKYKYNKDSDDFEGDELTQAAFASDIAKLKDDQEAFNKSIVMDEDGIPEVDDQGEFIIKDPNILSKIAKRRRTSPKVLAKKLGETTIKQKEKEALHAQQMGAIGGYALGGEEQPGDAIIGKYYDSDFEDKDGESSIAPVNSTEALEAMRKMIFGVESQGNYNIVAGGKGNFVNKGKHKGKELSELTVNELLEVQDAQPKNQRAAGAYQIMPKTLRGLVASGAISGDDIFDQEAQDKLFKTLLNDRGYEDYLAGDATQEGFSKGLGQEWAGIPMLSDTTRKDKIYKDGKWTGKYRSVNIERGQSFYRGYKDAGNVAGTTPEEVEEWFTEYGTTDKNKINYGGELPEVNISGGKSGLPTARSSDMAIASELTPEILPSPEFEPNPAAMDYADSNPYKGPFKKLRKKIWQKKHGVIDPVKEQEQFASLGTDLKGVAVGGYLDEEYDYNHQGYAIGGEKTGQALRMLGMATPALYNIGYNLTQEPKKLSGNYMTSGIQNPEPIDITPELRDIEKAGASARAGGRARSSMAGQIASQTAEQAAVSKAYRAKTSIDQQADLQVEQMNAGIRQQNAKMKYNVDLQNIQAEEAHQQYMNTGMSQIGQIAQTMGTESLQKDQLKVMKDYYDTMGEQGQAMLDQRRDEMLTEAELQKRMMDLQFGVQTPGAGDDKPLTDEDGNLIDAEGNIIEGAANMSLDADPITLDEGERLLYKSSDPEGDRLKAVNKMRKTAAIKGKDPSRGYKYAEGTTDISPEEWEKLEDMDLGKGMYNFAGSDNALMTYPTKPFLGGTEDGEPWFPGLAKKFTDATGIEQGTELGGALPFAPQGSMALSDEQELHKGVPTVNSAMDIMTDEQGNEIPYIIDGDQAQEFADWAYLEQQGTGWDKFKEDWLVTDWLTSDPEAPEGYNPMDYYDNPDEYKKDMIEFLASKGHSIRIDTEDGPKYYEYYSHIQDLGQGPRSTGKFGGTMRPETGSFTKFVEGAAGFISPGPKTVSRTAGLTKMIGKGNFIVKIGKGYQVVKGGSKVPAGMKAIVDPRGRTTIVKANQMVRKGWRQIAKAGETVGVKAARGQGIKTYAKGNILPRDLYITGTGDVMLKATGKALGYTAVAVKKLAKAKPIKYALGKGREGMQKAWRGTKYLFKDGQWWRITQKAKTVGRGAAKKTVPAGPRFPNLQGVPSKLKKDVGGVVKEAAKTAGIKLPKVNVNINLKGLSMAGKSAVKNAKGTTAAEKIADLKKSWKLSKPQLDKAIEAVQKAFNKAANKATRGGNTGGGTTGTGGNVNYNYTYTS